MLATATMVFVLMNVASCVSGDVTVDSCDSFLDALQDNQERTIYISGEVSCLNVDDWPSRLSIRRFLLIQGEEFGVSQISIPDSTTIHVMEDLYLTFRYLLFTVRGLEDGITLPFIKIERGAEVFVENSAIISETCEGQDIPNIGSRTIVDGDVGVFNARGEEILHSCNTAHLCESDKGSIKTDVVHSIEAQSARTECTRGSFSVDDTSSGSDSTVLVIAIVIPLIAGAVLLVMILAGVCVVRSRNEAKASKSNTEMALREHNRNTRNFWKLNSAGGNTLTGPREQQEPRHSGTNDPLALSNTNFKLSDIEIGEQLGRGSFGKVYRGQWQGTEVAVKCIVHGKSFLESSNEPFEAYLSRQVSHPNVVQTFIVHTVPAGGAAAPLRNEAFNESVATEVEQRESNNHSIMSSDDVFDTFAKGPGEHEAGSYETWIVLEFCDKGSLAHAIRDGCFHATENGQRRPNIVHAIQTALDIAHAMMYLHNVRIIHGDLKAENVLLKKDSSDPRGFVCKVGDFGLSRFLADDTHIETFTCGTITHMPPELLKGGVLTPAADVYSFAVLMWELLTGTNPYEKKTHAEIVLIVVNRQKRPSIPEYCSDGYAELLEDCWRQSHLERPGFPEIVDRLKDLLEEELANFTEAMEAHHIDIESKPQNTPAQMEIPSFPSCQPMSCDYGWTMESAGDSDCEADYPTGTHLQSIQNSMGNIVDPRTSSVDFNLDGKSNPCFMMSTELTTDQEILERASEMGFGRITEVDESETESQFFSESSFNNSHQPFLTCEKP